jgi:hypothetical protein
VGFRFFRRKDLVPGVRLNVSRSGPSLSFGVRGAHVTVGRRGVTRTVGLPGTGIFYTSRSRKHTGVHNSTHFATSSPESERSKLRRQLDDLHAAGVLTDAEYQEKRRALGE